jgi:hypothetical protein
MRKFHIARILTLALLVTALGMSFTHIADLFGLLGSDWQKWVAPFLIDTVAVIGKISMGNEFSAKTRRGGKRALIIAGSLSFLANVTVGFVEQRYGNAILGAITVAAALWAENHLHHLKPITRRTRKS